MANPTVIQVSQESPQFYDTLMAQQQQAFGENQAALQAVNNMWAPVVQGGAIPYGYSPQLDSLLQSNVISTGTQAESNSENAAALQEKQAAGGANVLPTGADAAINADITATGQQKIAQGLQQEKIAGYQQGVTNLEGATNAELGIASEDNPNSYAKSATDAGGLALSAGDTQFKENQSSSPFSSVLKDISGVVGVAEDIGGMAAGFMGTPSDGGSSGGAAQPGVEDDLSYI